MVRTLPAAISSALASSTQQPTLTVTVQDLINRFSLLTAGSGVDGRSKYLVTSAGTLIRATVGQISPNAGKLCISRVTNPLSAASWNSAQQTITSNCATGWAEPALVQTGSTIRCFYQRSNKVICYRDSSDDGLTWGAETVTQTTLPALNNNCYGLCADSTTSVLCAYGEYDVAATNTLRSTFSGGSWSAWHPEGPAPSWAGVRGLDQLGSSGTRRIAAGIQLNDVTRGFSACLCTYSGSAYGAWSAVQSLDNPNLGIKLSYPSLFFDGAGYYLAVLASDDGSVSGTAQTRTAIYASSDAVTWRPWQQLGNMFQYAAHLLIASGQVVVFDGSHVYFAPLPAAATDVSDDVLSISIAESSNRPARATIVLSNVSGAYNSATYLRADARVTLNLGYSGAAIATHSLIIDSVTWQANALTNTVVLSLRDTLKLLDYPSSRFYALSGYTVAQLVQWVAQQAGLGVATLPATAQFSQSVPCFVVNPGDTWLSLLDRIAGIYGFAYFGAEDGALHCWERGTADATTWTYGSEILAAQYGQSADQANVVRVIGQPTDPASTTAVWAEVIDGANILVTGYERYRHVVDRLLDTSAKCTIRAGLVLRDEQADASEAQLIVALNPAHQLQDVIAFGEAWFGLSGQKARIDRIAWQIDTNTATWIQRLLCTGV